jgi:hypothetical protein
MNLSNPDQVSFLRALRAAAACADAPVTHRPGDLVMAGHLPRSMGLAEVNAAASALYRKGYVARRTDFGVVRYAITEEGCRALAVAEARTPDGEEDDLLALAYAKADQEVIALERELDAARRRVEAARQEREALGRELDSRSAVLVS